MPRRTLAFHPLPVRPHLLALVALPLLGASLAHGDVIDVGPGDSIQAAIDDPETTDGDVIRVAPGTYRETINLRGLAITIRSADPSDPETVAATVIDGAGGGSVITCWNGEGLDTVFDGLTITGGASDSGGGMLNDGASPTIRRCVFRGNAAMFDGGAIFNIDGAPVIASCTFAGNTAFYGGAIANILSTPNVTNSVFTGNVAGAMGGAFDNFNQSHAMIASCTFAGNVAERGGAVSNDESSPAVFNAVLWGDAATEEGAEIYNYGASAPVIGYSDVAGSGGSESWDATLGTDAGGNLDADPMFADADGPDDVPGTTDDDVRATGGSPVIDAGSNEDVPRDLADLDGDGDVDEPTPVDLDGLARFFDDPDADDTGRGDAPLVDMGAYERFVETPACFGDFDGDGFVGRHDLKQLLRAWGPCDGCPEDLDENGWVGLRDLIELLYAWGPCGEEGRRPWCGRKIRKAYRKNDHRRFRRKVTRAWRHH